MENMNKNQTVDEGKARRLILWCLPRTGSTTLAKCLSFLDEDTEVWFEPYNTCRMADIMMKKDVSQGRAAEILDKMKLAFQSPTASLLSTYSGLQKSLEESQRRNVIVKEMAVASYDSYEYIPKGYRHVLLIRDPTRVIYSFWKMIIEPRGEEFADADLEKVHPTYPTHHWYGEMHALWKHLMNVGVNPLIIDTEDFMANPAPFLKKICEVMEVEYRDGLLEWDASKDTIKNWRNACIDMYTDESMAHAFQRAFESSSFGQTSPKPLPQNLTQDCVRIIGNCVDIFNEMYPHRFIPENN